MSLIVKAEPEKKFEKELLPEGSHVANCYSVIELGTIDTGKYGFKHKCMVGFEVPDEMRVFSEESGEQPMVVSKEYTTSLDKDSNLRKDLEAWRGKEFSEDELRGFDIRKLVGATGMISVKHKTKENGEKYATIASIIQLHKSTPKPIKINDVLIFDFEDNFENLSKLPEWIQKKIKSSKEYIKLEQSKSI